MALAEVLEGIEPTDAVSRWIIAEQTAWVLTHVAPFVAAADSSDGVWLYDTSAPREVGETRGLVALRGCEVIASAMIALYG